MIPHTCAVIRTTATLAACGLLSAAAQTVVFDLGPSTGAGDVIVDPFAGVNETAGLFLAAGYTLLSLDIEQNQASVVDSFPMLGRQLAAADSVLFEVGDTLPNNNRAWHVRRSLDGGGTWSSVMTDWQMSFGKGASASAVAVYGNGWIFVSGRAADNRGNYHPIIRRSKNDGTSWETILNGSTKGGNFDNIADIEFVPDVGPKQGGIYAAGRAGNNWTVWRSRDGGATWPIVRSWAPSKGIAEATSLASDAAGNVYVGGMGNRVNHPRDWYVWVTFDGAATWENLDCPLSPGTDSILNDLEVDPTGNRLWAVGSQGQFNWRMEGLDATGWTSLLPAYGGAGRTASPWGVTVDPLSGAFYVSGTTEDAGDYRGIVVQLDP